MLTFTSSTMLLPGLSHVPALLSSAHRQIIFIHAIYASLIAGALDKNTW